VIGRLREGTRPLRGSGGDLLQAGVLCLVVALSDRFSELRPRCV
jgi:hypothetical protein